MVPASTAASSAAKQSAGAALLAGTTDPGTVTISAYLCPSDPHGGKFNTTHIGWGNHMPGDYLGVSGTSVMARDGLFFSGHCVRLRDVTDGTSQTLAFGERGIPTDLETGWMLCAGGNEPVYTGNQDNHLSTAVGLKPPGPNDRDNDRHFWSWHPGGANFLFADGSVRVLGNAIDRSVLQRLSTRSAGDLAGEF